MEIARKHCGVNLQVKDLDVLIKLLRAEAMGLLEAARHLEVSMMTHEFEKTNKEYEKNESSKKENKPDVFDINTAKKSDLIKKIKEINPNYDFSYKRIETLRRELKSLLGDSMLVSSGESKEVNGENVGETLGEESVPPVQDVVVSNEELVVSLRPPGVVTDPDTVEKAGKLFDFLQKYSREDDHSSKIFAYWEKMGCDTNCVRPGGACPNTNKCYEFWDDGT